MARFIAAIPKIVVALLLVAAIVNLLIGVFLRYVMIQVTDWLDIDPIRFTWVEEVGEMLLAWLTLIGAAIGVRERTHFTLHVLRLSAGAPGCWVERIHHVLIAVFGGAGRLVRREALHAQPHAGDARPGDQSCRALRLGGGGRRLLVVYAMSMIVAPPPHDRAIVPLDVRAE